MKTTLAVLKKCILVAGMIVLPGCGGGNYEAFAGTKLTDLVVIGNSLTKYNPVPSIGWYGSWGMAASAAGKDFSHIVAASMNLPLTSASSFAGLELTPVASVGDIQVMASSVKPTTLVVIQLGDNVQLGNLPAFATSYGKLLDAVKHAQVLICLGTWGGDVTRDKIIEDACRARSGRYIFIGDIRTDSSSQDAQGAQFADAGVNMHPHDWSMARIAERIVSAAF